VDLPEWAIDKPATLLGMTGRILLRLEYKLCDQTFTRLDIIALAEIDRLNTMPLASFGHAGHRMTFITEAPNS
jgi:hypothetical protein